LIEDNQPVYIERENTEKQNEGRLQIKNSLKGHFRGQNHRSKSQKSPYLEALSISFQSVAMGDLS
jgi:hypothetical protein